MTEMVGPDLHFKRVDSAHQRLIFRGKQPDNNWTLADLGISDGAELRLMGSGSQRTACRW